MRSRSWILCVAGAAFLLPGCHLDNLGLHGCPTTYNSSWRGLGFDLEHTEPEDCPVYIPYAGAQLQTGAVVVDEGTRDGRRSFLRVFDHDGFTVAYVDDPFGYDGYGRWVAATYPSYSAGRVQLSPDRALYLIDLLYVAGYAPEAWMTLTYTDRVLAWISGPGLVSSGATATYTANVTAGTPPFTYRWYLDWEPVGTSSSYTTTLWGPSEAELRLDVIDARGEAVSRTRLIEVSECSDGLRSC